MLNDLWNRFVRLAHELDICRLEILAKESDVVGATKESLGVPHMRGAAFELIGFLTDVERQQLMPILLDLACYANKYQAQAFSAICTLPRRWLVENIGAHTKDIVDRITEEEVGPLLHLLWEVHPELCSSTARELTAHDDGTVRQIARAFLDGVQG